MPWCTNSWPRTWIEMYKTCSCIKCSWNINIRILDEIYLCHFIQIKFEWLREMDGYKKWKTARNGWLRRMKGKRRFFSRAFKYIAVLRLRLSELIYMYTAWRWRQVTCKLKCHVIAQHVTGDIKCTSTLHSWHFEFIRIRR